MPSRLKFVTPLAALALLLLALTGVAQERDRAKIPDRYKWNLADLYPSAAAWRAAKDSLQARIPQLGRFKGRLARSAGTLADALDMKSSLGKELWRLYSYAGMLADQDTRDAEHQGMRQEMVQLAASFSAEASYIEPEVLRFAEGTVPTFLASEPRLGVYRFHLEDLARRAAHTLSDAEEKLLAGMGPLSASPENTFNILSHADFPYPTIALSDGRAVKVDQPAYEVLRASPNRADRQKAMSSFLQALGAFSRTFGTTMNGEVQQALFFSNARKYPSALEAALDRPNIPMSVYTRLVDGVKRSLPAFHRYLRLRKRMLGVDELHYYDLYAPLVSSLKLEYTAEEAQKHILASVAPLGTDYASVVRRAFDERWIDYFPAEGKQSGGYSNGGAYDVHPYILVNYNGKYDDMSTLAHELGHAMHSYYSNRTQPFPVARYPTFVAEVASTFNEALLLDHLLRQIRDKDARLSLLGNYLESIKGTVFRQAQFAEFELRMHEMAQKGQPVTGDALAKLYLGITRQYYGHDQRVCIVDDYIAHEWSYVPHFYGNFYVFQYATSFAASSALAGKVKAGGAGGAEAARRYLAFLGSGGSKYPIDLLREAGVDMTSDEPLQLAVQEMNRVMDEMEKLLAQ